MDIRDGLSGSLLADFESCVSKLPTLLAQLKEPAHEALLGDTLTAETLAMTLFTFRSPDAARRYLKKPRARLTGHTPLACIKNNGASREMVIGDLFRIIEGYAF